MTNITQGQNLSGDPKARTSTSRRGPRRSVLIGSIGSLVLGVVLSTTALPAMANIVQPSADLGSGTTTTVATTSTTVATTTTTIARRVVHARVRVVHHSHVVATTSLKKSGSDSNGSPSPTTTTPPPTTVVTPTTVAPTTVPVKKAPALSISNPSANIAPSPDFMAPGQCAMGSTV